jgi:hypothetical protein
VPTTLEKFLWKALDESYEGFSLSEIREASGGRVGDSDAREPKRGEGKGKDGAREMMPRAP